MRKRLRRMMMLALLIAAAAMFPTKAQAQFGGGDGTSDNPYIIATTDHWLELANSVNNGNFYYDVTFELTADLDFSGIDFIPIGGARIGGGYTYFSGTFNGGDHRILNVRMGRSIFAGLFGYIIGGTVNQLTLGGNSRIEGGQYVGGIVGMSVGRSTITYCHVEKTVTIAASANGSYGIGGIVGTIDGDYSGVPGNNVIASCTNAATVTSNGKSNVRYVGGIVGQAIARLQNIRYCTNYGAVSGHEYVGGVAGHFDFSQPNNVLATCYTGANCTLYGVGQEGSSQGINMPGQAVSMHTITFGEDVQGRVNTPPAATFEGNDFYAAGWQVSLDLNNSAVGYLSPRFNVNGELHNSGKNIEFTMPAEDVTVTLDGVLRDIGYEPWVSVSLSPTSFEYNGNVQIPAVTITDTKSGTPVTLTEGTDYEVLPPSDPINPGYYKLTINGIGIYGGTVEAQYSITPSGGWLGMGTAEKPYLIFTTDDMKRIADHVNSGNTYEGQHFSLQNDLDYSGKEYFPIGNSWQDFKGTFHGNGHTISHVFIQGDQTYALFNNIGEGGVVNGLTLGEGSYIEGSWVGGIAAECYGTVSDCSTAEGVVIKAKNRTDYPGLGMAPIQVLGDAGGIVCKLRTTGSIVNCLNRASISFLSTFGPLPGMGGVDKGNVGGIAQYIEKGSISNCLNLGAVSSRAQVGGILGYLDGGNISNCYYAGACSVGGIGGSDVAGQAMRGYAVSVAPANLGAKTAENSFMTAYENGLFHNGKYYVGSIGLYDAAANDELMADICTNLSITVPVVLQGRTLYKTGIWNTICLPFGLSSFAGTPLADATVKQLVSSDYNASTGTLTLNFSTVSEIEAGKPYIVKWASGENAVNPVFNGVTVSSNAVSTVKTDYVDFIGCYSPVSLAAQDRSVLYMGSDSKLYYPSVEVPVNAFRGHFQLKNGFTAGDLPTNGAKAIVLNFGDETTGLTAVESGQLRDDSWYSIDGKKLSGEPTKKGVYIKNGRKIVK